MYVALEPGHLKAGMQDSPALKAIGRDVDVLEKANRVLAHQGVAVVSQRGDGVATISMVVPDLIGEKLELRGILFAVKSEHFLQKDEIGVHFSNRTTHQIEHPAPPQVVKSLVNIVGQHAQLHDASAPVAQRTSHTSAPAANRPCTSAIQGTGTQ